ncbi:MAG TPA: hypothetical protein VKB38_21565 [Terracidiphilus sp.]|nr:hypothetical protein [Terracidiphilus sp.]
MSQYDIAAGVTLEGANSLIATFYAQPAARNGLFKGSKTEDIDGIGKVTVTYDVKKAPTVVLAPPTQANWEASQRRDPEQKTPPSNTIQVLLSTLAGTATVGDAPPLPAEGPVTVYGTVTADKGNVKIRVTAVLIDESSFSDWDKLIVNMILLPEIFKMSDSMIPAIVLPTLPKFAGLEFQTLALAVTDRGILLGSSLVGGGTTNLGGFSWPGTPIFAMATLIPFNKLLANEVSGTHEIKDSTGPSEWTAAGKITAKDLKMTARLSGPTIFLDTGGSFSGYGELSGVGVGITKTALCPIATAVDAIADPSGWDKVVSSFDIQYKPQPMPVPVTFTADAPSGTPKTQNVTAKVPSDKLPSDIQVIFAPTWSGSVTGTVLGAAAMGFLDLVLVIFGKLIINDLVGKYASKSFSLPVSEMSQTISMPGGGSVTVSLSAATGQALVPFGGNQLTQSLQIAIS